MSRVLLDTHALLWFAFDDPRLSEGATRVIADSSIDKVLSVASLWEIAIKLSLGKLDLGMSFDRFLASEVEGRELELLHIAGNHLSLLTRLPLHHRDPFDRLLVAQATVESLVIATSDSRFAAYGVPLVW